MRNIWSNKMKKKPEPELVLKMNELYWENGFSLYRVARELNASLPVAQRVVTLTRNEYLKIKERFAR